MFVGDGANRASIGAAAGNHPNIRFLPFRPVAQVPHVMMAGDLHVITVRRGLEGVVVPSKLYSTLAAGRPVLVVAPKESDAARIVSESAAAWPSIPMIRLPWRKRFASFATILQASQRWRSARREVANRYARVNELERFVGIMEDAAREKNGGSHLES